MKRLIILFYYALFLVGCSLEKLPVDEILQKEPLTIEKEINENSFEYAKMLDIKEGMSAMRVIYLLGHPNSGDGALSETSRFSYTLPKLNDDEDVCVFNIFLDSNKIVKQTSWNKSICEERAKTNENKTYTFFSDEIFNKIGLTNNGAILLSDLFKKKDDINFIYIKLHVDSLDKSSNFFFQKKALEGFLKKRDIKNYYIVRENKDQFNFCNKDLTIEKYNECASANRRVEIQINRIKK